MRFQTKVAQLADRFETEGRDCTVHALAFATGLAYSEAHNLLAAAGRENGKGFHTEVIMGRLSVLTQRRWFATVALCWSRGYTTVNQFCKLHPTGTYVLRIKGHAFAVVNGRAIDTHERSARSRVLGAWEVYSAAQAVAAI